MRTTINVDDQLLVQAKVQAATLGVTLAQLIEDALRESLMRRENMEQRGRVRLIPMPGEPRGQSPNQGEDLMYRTLSFLGSINRSQGKRRCALLSPVKK
jgi:hypothetical protein